METKSTFLQFCLLLLFLSCNQQRKAMEKNNPSIEAPDPMASYSPGDNWSLQWSDEFEGDTINRNNWSYQVEPPGRFNDEWQSYTNSSDNAYVENSCLVIKATHISENHGLGQYTSARIHSAQKQTFRYGKIAGKKMFLQDTPGRVQALILRSQAFGYVRAECSGLPEKLQRHRR